MNISTHEDHYGQIKLLIESDVMALTSRAIEKSWMYAGYELPRMVSTKTYHNFTNLIELSNGDAPDIQITNVTLDETVIQEGGQTTIRYHVENTGNTDAPGVVQAIYISTDDVFDELDTLIDTDTSSALPAGGADTNEQETLQALSEYSAGNYYIFVVADCPSSYKTAQISAWAKRDFAHLVG